MAASKHGKHSAPSLDTTTAYAPARAHGKAAKKVQKPGMSPAKIVGILALSFLALCLVAYSAGVFYFTGHALPHTYVGKHDISYASADEVTNQIGQMSKDFAVTVSGKGVDFDVSAKNAGISIEPERVSRSILGEWSAWSWPLEFFGNHDATNVFTDEFSTNGVSSYVEKQINDFNATGTDPVNAGIAYNNDSGAFEIVPEKPGTKMDVQKVTDAVKTAIVDMNPQVKLTDSELIAPSVLKDDPRLSTAVDTANGYTKANVEVVLGTTAIHAATIDASQISKWVQLDDDYNVAFNEDAMNEWVATLVQSLDTVGTERTYTRPDGKTFTVSGGTYGWEIKADDLESQIKDAITAGETTQITAPTEAEGYTWAGAGKPDWGAYVDVDLTEQHARFYDENGELKWESDFVSGKPDGKHDTTPGIWRLFNKETPSVLKGDVQVSTGKPEYEQPVDYWMAFTYSGIGFHDAVWQSAFGGTRYKDGYGSHGCINLSHDAAASLFDLINVGNAVVVHS